MKRVDSLSPEAEARAEEFLRIGNTAIRKAREENLRLGLPNVSERNGKTIMEMPDGSEVAVDTEKQRERPPEAA